jgi:hypothetical protein
LYFCFWPQKSRPTPVLLNPVDNVYEPLPEKDDFVTQRIKKANRGKMLIYDLL